MKIDQKGGEQAIMLACVFMGEEEAWNGRPLGKGVQQGKVEITLVYQKLLLRVYCELYMSEWVTGGKGEANINKAHKYLPFNNSRQVMTGRAEPGDKNMTQLSKGAFDRAMFRRCRVL